MPRTGSDEILSFDIAPSNMDLDRALYELRKADKTLYNEMRREFRKEIRPIANELKGNIHRGGSPLSGMSRSQRIAKTRMSVEERSPFVWKLPGTKIDVGTRRSGRRGTQSIVRIVFTDKRPFAAFSVLEPAREGRGLRGRNMVAGINSKYGPVGKGRWVIQQFYDRKGEMVRIAGRIVGKYVSGVNRRLGKRVRGF